MGPCSPAAPAESPAARLATPTTSPTSTASATPRCSGPGHDRRREHAVEGGCGAPEEAQHHSLNGPRRYEYLYIFLVDCCNQTVMLIISSVLKSSLLTPNMSVTFIEMLILLNYN